jgi:hypothetical protein
MSEFMIASCEAEEVLKEVDTITANGIDYTYKDVGDWAYIYSDKDDQIDPREVTHVNGKSKRFGIKGVGDFAKNLILNGDGCLDDKGRLIEDYLLKTLGRYYNLDHPDIKKYLNGGWNNMSEYTKEDVGGRL